MLVFECNHVFSLRRLPDLPFSLRPCLFLFSSNSKIFTPFFGSSLAKEADCGMVGPPIMDTKEGRNWVMVANCFYHLLPALRNYVRRKAGAFSQEFEHRRATKKKEPKDILADFVRKGGKLNSKNGDFDHFPAESTERGWELLKCFVEADIPPLSSLEDADITAMNGVICFCSFKYNEALKNAFANMRQLRNAWAHNIGKLTDDLREAALNSIIKVAELLGDEKLISFLKAQLAIDDNSNYEMPREITGMGLAKALKDVEIAMEIKTDALTQNISLLVSLAANIDCLVAGVWETQRAISSLLSKLKINHQGQRMLKVIQRSNEDDSMLNLVYVRPEEMTDVSQTIAEMSAATGTRNFTTQQRITLVEDNRKIHPIYWIFIPITEYFVPNIAPSMIFYCGSIAQQAPNERVDNQVMLLNQHESPHGPYSTEPCRRKSLSKLSILDGEFNNILSGDAVLANNPRLCGESHWHVSDPALIEVFKLLIIHETSLGMMVGFPSRTRSRPLPQPFFPFSFGDVFQCMTPICDRIEGNLMLQFATKVIFHLTNTESATAKMKYHRATLIPFKIVLEGTGIKDISCEKFQEVIETVQHNMFAEGPVESRSGIFIDKPSSFHRLYIAFKTGKLVKVDKWTVDSVKICSAEDAIVALTKSKNFEREKVVEGVKTVINMCQDTDEDLAEQGFAWFNLLCRSRFLPIILEHFESMSESSAIGQSPFMMNKELNSSLIEEGATPFASIPIAYSMFSCQLCFSYCLSLIALPIKKEPVGDGGQEEWISFGATMKDSTLPIAKTVSFEPLQSSSTNPVVIEETLGSENFEDYSTMTIRPEQTELCNYLANTIHSLQNSIKTFVDGPLIVDLQKAISQLEYFRDEVQEFNLTTIAIVGANGLGKSTLLNVLLMLTVVEKATYLSLEFQNPPENFQGPRRNLNLTEDDRVQAKTMWKEESKRDRKRIGDVFARIHDGRDRNAGPRVNLQEDLPAYLLMTAGSLDDRAEEQHVTTNLNVKVVFGYTFAAVLTLKTENVIKTEVLTYVQMLKSNSSSEEHQGERAYYKLLAEAYVQDPGTLANIKTIKDVVLHPRVLQISALGGMQRFCVGDGLDLDWDRLKIREFVKDCMYPMDLSSYDSVEDRLLRRLLIDSLCIYVPSTLLRNGLCLVDTPGLNDPVPLHAAFTNYAAAQADALVVVTSKTIGADEAALKLLRQAGKKSRLMICSQVSEIKDDYLAGSALFLNETDMAARAQLETTSQNLNMEALETNVVGDGTKVVHNHQSVSSLVVSSLMLPAMVLDYNWQLPNPAEDGTSCPTSAEALEAAMECTGMLKLLRELESCTSFRSVKELPEPTAVLQMLQEQFEKTANAEEDPLSTEERAQSQRAAELAPFARKQLDQIWSSNEESLHRIDTWLGTNALNLIRSFITNGVQSSQWNPFLDKAASSVHALNQLLLTPVVLSGRAKGSDGWSSLRAALFTERLPFSSIANLANFEENMRTLINNTENRLITELTLVVLTQLEILPTSILANFVRDSVCAVVQTRIMQNFFSSDPKSFQTTSIGKMLSDVEEDITGNILHAFQLSGESSFQRWFSELATRKFENIVLETTEKVLTERLNELLGSMTSILYTARKGGKPSILFTALLAGFSSVLHFNAVRFAKMDHIQIAKELKALTYHTELVTESYRDYVKVLEHQTPLCLTDFAVFQQRTQRMALEFLTAGVYSISALPNAPFLLTGDKFNALKRKSGDGEFAKVVQSQVDLSEGPHIKALSSMLHKYRLQMEPYDEDSTVSHTAVSHVLTRLLFGKTITDAKIKGETENNIQRLLVLALYQWDNKLGDECSKTFKCTAREFALNLMRSDSVPNLLAFQLIVKQINRPVIVWFYNDIVKQVTVEIIHSSLSRDNPLRHAYHVAYLGHQASEGPLRDRITTPVFAVISPIANATSTLTAMELVHPTGLKRGREPSTSPPPTSQKARTLRSSESYASDVILPSVDYPPIRLLVDTNVFISMVDEDLDRLQQISQALTRKIEIIMCFLIYEELDQLLHHKSDVISEKDAQDLEKSQRNYRQIFKKLMALPDNGNSGVHFFRETKKEYEASLHKHQAFRGQNRNYPADRLLEEKGRDLAEQYGLTDVFLVSNDEHLQPPQDCRYWKGTLQELFVKLG